MSNEHKFFLKQREWDIERMLAWLEDALRKVDVGNNACFSSPDSRESMRKRLNLILKQFEEKS